MRKKVLEEAKALPIPDDVLRGQRRVFYARVLNWIDREYGENHVLKREYRDYYEPDQKASGTIYHLLDHGIVLVALGVERAPKPGQQVKVSLVEMTKDEHWSNFVSLYKPLVVVRPRQQF